MCLDSGGLRYRYRLCRLPHFALRRRHCLCWLFQHLLNRMAHQNYKPLQFHLFVMQYHWLGKLNWLLAGRQSQHRRHFRQALLTCLNYQNFLAQKFQNYHLLMLMRPHRLNPQHHRLTPLLFQQNLKDHR
jgi:hypothetical protein